MNGFRKYWIMGLSCAGMLCSCQDSPRFSAYGQVDRDAWYSEDTVVMPVQQMDELLCGKSNLDVEVLLGIRYTADYRYRNLSLLWELTDEGRVVARDTVHFSLYNNVGKSQGRGFVFYDTVQPSRRVSLKAGRNYEMRVTHLMRLNPIEGVTDVQLMMR